MQTGFWGKKLGMTQVFVGNKVVPVTVIDASSWVFTQVKTQEKDGYASVQVALPRDRYCGQAFSAPWLKDLKTYFKCIREVRLSQLPEGIEVGKSVSLWNQLQPGDEVTVTGITKGSGFAGVVRRWDFTGGTNSHGSNVGRRPGSIGFLRTSGKVIKGKKLPGRMGNAQRSMLNLEVVRIENDAQLVLVKGSVPGKAGSFVFVGKRG